MKVLLILACASAAFGQATVHLRYGAGNPVPITADTASVGSQVTLTSTGHPFHDGDYVWCWNAQNDWAVDGTRVVTSTTANNFKLNYVSGNPVLKNGAFGAYAPLLINGTWQKVAFCGPTLPYTLTAAPNLLADGPGGSITTAITDPGSGAAPRAVGTNPAWVGLHNYISNTGIDTTYAWDSASFGPYFRGGGFIPNLALGLNWLSAHGNTNSLAAAKYWIGPSAAYVVQGMACMETVRDCGDVTNEDYAVAYWPWTIMSLFNFLDGGGQLSAGDISTFDDMVLNDSNDENTCNATSYVLGTGTVAAWNSTTGVVTGSGTNWSTSLHHGDVFWVGPNTPVNAASYLGSPLIVGTVTSDTSITLLPMTESLGCGAPACSGGNFSGQAYAWQSAPPWQSGQCGWAWWGKHGASSGLSPYPQYGPIGLPGGGSNGQTDPTNNHILSNISAYLAMGTVTANHDARGARLYEGAANFWNDILFPNFQQYWTGVANGGDSQYFFDRYLEFVGFIVHALRNSTGGAVDYSTGSWLKNSMLYMVYDSLHNGTTSMGFGNPGFPFGISQAFTRNFNYGKIVPQALWSLYPTSNESKYLHYWNQNISGQWTSGTSGSTGLGNGGSNSWNYLFFDPSTPTADYRTVLPTAHAFITSDGAHPHGTTNVVMSWDGWNYSPTSTDAGLWIDAASIYSAANSHWVEATNGTWGPGTYQIYQGIEMLADDSGGPGVTYGAGYSGVNGSKNASITTNYLEIGGTTNLIAPTGYTTWVAINVPRYGDGGASKYMYTQVDTSGAYTAAMGVTRALRSFVDFKGGSQRYIIVDDEVATSAGQIKRRFIQMPNNSQTGEGATTFTQASNSILSLGPSGGAALLTEVLFPQTAGFTYTDNPDGSYTGGNGQTFRVSACLGSGTTAANCDAANTSGEILTIHMPTMNQSATMPTLTLLTATGFTGIQIEDATSPKVAFLNRSGTLQGSLTATTTFPGGGNAQYVVGGLAANTYNVTVGGVTVLSGALVSANDNSLYFEGPAGLVQISAGTAAGGQAVQGKVSFQGKVNH